MEEVSSLPRLVIVMALFRAVLVEPFMVTAMAWQAGFIGLLFLNIV